MLIARVNIKGMPWKFRLLSPATYIKHHDASTCGMTILSHKHVDFRTDSFDLTTVIHELMHCYFSEAKVESANLTSAQTEEVFCSLVADHIQDILGTAKLIYERLSK